MNEIHFNADLIDWNLLRKQKNELVQTLNYFDEHFQNPSTMNVKIETIEGLLGFIDLIQDCAADVLGEKAIFGPDGDDNE